jgi:tryptophan-rich sensory protein
VDYQPDYKNFKLPPLSPPSYLFGIVWPFLYLLIFISYGFVLYQIIKGNLGWRIFIPFGINLLTNALFTYFQFGLKNNYLALADILIVLITIIWTIILIWPQFRWVAYLQIPYLLWVTFATYLQIGVTILNK